jgi:peptidoglycan-associated lipoprotein
LLTVVGLGVAALLLGGCPKTPVVTSGTGAVTGKPPAPAAAPGRAPAPAPAAAPAPRPAPPAASTSSYVTTAALKDIHFAVDRAAVRPEDAAALDANAQWLKANPGVLVAIEGHADERGSDAHNLALGDRRAKAARDALVARGIEPARITIRAYGEQRPVCTERGAACWAKNRRAHFLVKV